MASVQPGPARASTRRGIHLDAVEQGFERRVVDLDMPRAFGSGLGQAEGAAVEPFVKNAHPAAVEEQDFKRVASTPVEDEERAAARLVADLLLGAPGEPVERAAQVDRIERHEHLHPLRDHASSPSALTTRRSSASSKPARTDTRGPPTATMIESSTRDWLRTTRAIRTRGWRFFGAAAPTRPRRRQLAQYTSVDALNSRPSANSLAVRPLSFQSRTRSDHFDSVSVIRAACGVSHPGERTGAVQGVHLSLATDSHGCTYVDSPGDHAPDAACCGCPGSSSGSGTTCTLDAGTWT